MAVRAGIRIGREGRLSALDDRLALRSPLCLGAIDGLASCLRNEGAMHLTARQRFHVHVSDVSERLGKIDAAIGESDAPLRDGIPLMRFFGV